MQQSSNDPELAQVLEESEAQAALVEVGMHIADALAQQFAESRGLNILKMLRDGNCFPNCISVLTGLNADAIRLAGVGNVFHRKLRYFNARFEMASAHEKVELEIQLDCDRKEADQMSKSGMVMSEEYMFCADAIALSARLHHYDK